MKSCNKFFHVKRLMENNFEQKKTVLFFVNNKKVEFKWQQQI